MKTWDLTEQDYGYGHGQGQRQGKGSCNGKGLA